MNQAGDTNSARSVGIVGLGYVGLPLSMLFCEKGFHVVGVDVSASRVEQLLSGSSPIDDVRGAAIAEAVREHRFMPTADYAALRQVDSICICVPTPLRKTKDPDMSYVLDACERLAPLLRDGQLVILESTVYPGATEEMVAPILERSGLHVGIEMHLAFSPERVDPGNRTHPLSAIPKVVGGVTPACTDRAVALYAQVFDTVLPVANAREAEMAKLLENTFRAVNIGLVNELAIVAHKMGVSIWHLIDAASSKPFGFMPFYPGPGLGGHCIPIDPFYLSWKAKMFGADVGFIELADRVNSHMPAYVVERIAELLNDRGLAIRGARILVLGVSYKRNVADTRESPALDVLGLLLQRGAQVRYSDPHVPHIEVLGVPLDSCFIGEEILQDQDCVVITTDHDAFDWPLIARAAPAVFDARNALKGVDGPKDHIHVL